MLCNDSNQLNRKVRLAACPATATSKRRKRNGAPWGTLPPHSYGAVDNVFKDPGPHEVSAADLETDRPQGRTDSVVQSACSYAAGSPSRVLLPAPSFVYGVPASCSRL